ncbi:MAG: glutamate synthase large subunit [Spirochaetaceae bacterium]|jgi:glutamate synthase (NADPH/NADH) large chain|nr:glutamate synthase large subunit [Spirochaetaceae bacterium]
MGGLYRSEYEHDACGIGFVANISGKKEYAILERGLEVLERMEHRGAESADNKTGDGAGLLLQIPHSYYRTVVAGLPEAGAYGTGLLFLPKGAELARRVEDALPEIAAQSSLAILAERDVPVESGVLGAFARSTEPQIKQLFLVSAPAVGEVGAVSKKGAAAPPFGGQHAPLPPKGAPMPVPNTTGSIASTAGGVALYLFRKRLEKVIYADEELRKAGCYMPSLSNRVIVYKGMMMPDQVRAYFPELTNGKMETAVALVHSRFSTNTFPEWPLAQPFRIVAHNGEINSVKGNRFWARAREALFASPKFGAALADILPVIEPDKSDSASFDNMLELLVLAGRTLPEVLMMMIPEAWNEKNPIPDELKAFYEYHACMMEPWDGPASMVFCDGRYVGGTLDRNGLRPSRYTITKDGLLVMGSETGVQDFKPEEIAYKGRLLPGKLLLVDLEEGRIIPDAEVKHAVATAKPYADWVEKNVITLEQREPVDLLKPAPEELLFMERAFGYTREDRSQLLLPMTETGQEPTASMGTDTPLAVFSAKPQRVFAYFKQLFAQVTNPPIDSIREDLVMSLTSFVGPERNLLEGTEAHCKRIKVKNPVILPVELERLELLDPAAFPMERFDAVFDGEGETSGACSLEKAIDNLCAAVIEAVQGGASLIVLCDKEATEPKSGKIAIPSLLATGAVHHALIKAGLRMKASLIVDTAEPREIMHFALLFGYGADLVCPYGALTVISDICRGFDGKRSGEYTHAAHNYMKGISKALLKVSSKMGTSTLRSYRGAQIFEALGLQAEVIDKCFCLTPSRIGGATFADLEAEARARYREALVAHRTARPGNSPADGLLVGDGQYRYRKNGEAHAWNPDTIHLLQWAARTGDFRRFKQFSEAANALHRTPHVIRGLLDFKKGGNSVPLDEVESAEEIMKRFTTGAMSFGSISREAHETIAAALNSIKGRSNSGEGGEEAERFAKKPDGTWKRSAIKQVASARFGVTSEYLANCIELQIKMAQGAKPGEGGQLPGHKVDVAIARVRHSTPGVTLISPPPHHDIYSIEDLAELIFDLKNANPDARISVKLVSEVGVGTVAAGVAKAHADNILISGYDGGTGASPQSSIRHAGIPWELGLAETHQTLVRNGLRGRVRLQTDGQLKTGRDIVIAGMLGAEEFGFGTATLIVLGCMMMRKCHENTCPMGVATQDAALRARFQGKPEHLVNFFRFLAEEVREIMAELGVRRFNDLVGRSDLLVERPVEWKSDKPKVRGVNLAALLHREEGPEGIEGGKEQFCTQSQVHKIDNVLDRRLIEECAPALETKTQVSLTLPVKNTDRAVGTMLSGRVSLKYGGAGLPDNTIIVDFKGSAGQSFGAFLAPGITFRLHGDANDYLGKGLSGGRLVVAPPAGSTFKSAENIIVGNTLLYGATSGEAYIAGVAGERFCVRNSGATAVVEGAGDHCAEYMTGGRLVVLGNVGRNFAAGMSGGIAYVLDLRGNFAFYLNHGMVELTQLTAEPAEDEVFVKRQIENHVKWTGSAYAKSILGKWDGYRARFYKVMPIEYKRALEQQKIAALDAKLKGIHETEDLDAVG